MPTCCGKPMVYIVSSAGSYWWCAFIDGGCGRQVPPTREEVMEHEGGCYVL